MTNTHTTDAIPSIRLWADTTIVDLIPPDRWRHVRSVDNPANCASRGLYLSELIEHSLWRNDPTWLKQPSLNWPEKVPLPPKQQEVEEKEISLLVVTRPSDPIIYIDKFSSYDHLKRVTAWIICFIKNSQTKNSAERNKGYLTTTELQTAENYWIKVIQVTHFQSDLILFQYTITSTTIY